jgi:hypothetical protein
MSDNSFQKRRRDDLREYLSSLGFTHMMTVNYDVPISGGRDTRQTTLLRHLRFWNREMLEGMFGRKFPIRNQNDEFFFAAFLETGVLYQKDHLHLLVRVPDGQHGWFENHAGATWDRAKRDGSNRRCTADVAVVRIFDVAGAVRYCTKDLAAHPDRMVLSSEFRKTPSQ